MDKQGFLAANGFMAVCFAVFAMLQFNDPDPMYWMLLYFLGSMACVLFHLKRLPPSAAGSYAILCGALALLWILFSAMGRPLPGAVPGMAYEVEKETLGFLLVGSWMAILYFRAKRAGMR